MAAATNSAATATPPSELAEVLYTPHSQMERPGGLLRSTVHDFLRSRHVAWRLFTRDLKAQYRQSLLGWFWAFIPPLANAFIFIFLQAQGGMNFEGIEGIPYQAFAVASTILWGIFVDAIQIPLKTVTAAKSMIVKINFPREALLFASAGMILFNAMVRFPILVAVFLVFGLNVDGLILLFPLGVLGLMLLGAALGLLLIPIGLLYTDVSKGLPLLVQFWLFLTPVGYGIAEAGFARTIQLLNPVTYAILPAKYWLFSLPAPMLGGFAILLAVSTAVLIVGWLVYRLALPHLIARMGM